ncbi:MAG: COG1361 S-layer family protein [Candidatus Nanoarchaeia archaeon]|nr:COG1361 S-layer family protein [Candidatus Nanoarchaeia archaeon]
MKKELLIGVLCIFFLVLTKSSFAVISSSADIQVTMVNQNPDPAEPGNYVDVNFRIENIGSSNAEDVIFEILPKYPFFLDPGETAKQNIGSVWGRQIGDEGIILKYRLKVDEDAVEGENEISVRYSLNKGAAWQKPGNFYVNIRTHDAILNIKRVTYIPDPMPPGEKAVLSIHLENMADSLLKDIQIELNLITMLQSTTSVTYEELPFSPSGTTNKQVIKNIESGKTETVDFTLIPDPDASADIYKIPITVQYSDELGTNYSKTEIISVIVGDEPLLEPLLDSSDVFMKGQAGMVYFSFINKGTTDVKLLDVELKESDYIKVISPSKVYLGNVDSDDYETAEFKIYIKDVVDSKVPLVLNYKYLDPNNNLYEKEETVYIDSYTKDEAKKYGINGYNGLSGFMIILIIIVVGVSIYFVYRWWKKREKGHKN